MSDKEDEQAIPLLLDTPSSSVQPNGPLIRAGTVWTAIAHVITGVIGSGVLSLAWSVAQLGWIAGPLCIMVFGVIAVVVSYLLCDCYRSPDPQFGPARNPSYTAAVKSYLAPPPYCLYYVDAYGVFQEKRACGWVCGAFVQESYYGYGIAYTITAAISMRAIQKSDCYHKGGHNAPCEYGDSHMLLFGAVQDTDGHNHIGVNNSLSGDGKIKGDIYGVYKTTVVEKVWVVAQAIGDIAFAFTYNIILLEIEDTLKSPPPENQTMKKASAAAILLTTTLYLCCACFGYAAFGDQTPGNLLTGFGFYEPYWLVDFANASLGLHLVGGYQVYSQPLFAEAERWITKKLPDKEFVNNVYTIKLPMLPVFKLNLLRLCFRTTYVASTTGIALLFPYFNDVLGVLGALNFWPLAIYFPAEILLGCDHCSLCWVRGGAYNFQIELRNVFAARVSVEVSAFGYMQNVLDKLHNKKKTLNFNYIGYEREIHNLALGRGGGWTEKRAHSAEMIVCQPGLIGRACSSAERSPVDRPNLSGARSYWNATELGCDGARRVALLGSLSSSVEGGRDNSAELPIPADANWRFG
ncbi:hypothetical protein ACSBR2_027893 [Camellia fascicularis]